MASAVMPDADLAPPKSPMRPWYALLWVLACAHHLHISQASKAVFIKGMQAGFLAGVTKAVRNLVFGGGGFKGLAFVEVLKAMVDYDHTAWHIFSRRLRTLSGVSVGAITAAALAVGASPWQLEEEIVKTNYQAISQWGGMDAMDHMAILDPRGLTDTIKNVLRRFAGTSTVTFAQVRKRFGVRLRIYVANLSKQRLEVIDDTTHPHTKVWFAVKVSCSLPPYFPRVKWRGDIYVDGGIFSHSPGIGEPGLSPHTTLFLFLKEPVSTAANWIDYLMLLKASLQNSQNIAISAHFPQFAPATIMTTASQSTLLLLTRDLTAEQRRNFRLDGRRGIQAFLRAPTAAAILIHNMLDAASAAYRALPAAEPHLLPAPR